MRNIRILRIIPRAIECVLQFSISPQLPPAKHRIQVMNERAEPTRPKTRNAPSRHPDCGKLDRACSISVLIRKGISRRFASNPNIDLAIRIAHFFQGSEAAPMGTRSGCVGVQLNDRFRSLETFPVRFAEVAARKSNV